MEQGPDAGDVVGTHRQPNGLSHTLPQIGKVLHPSYHRANLFLDPTLLDHVDQHPDVNDVVGAHHRHNGGLRVPAPERLQEVRNQQVTQASTGGPHVPAPEQLQEVRNQQVTQAPTTAHEGSASLNANPQSVQAPVPSMAPTEATSDGVLMGHATKFWSYPHKFREVIERAKLIAQCECVTKDPFPARSTFLDQTSGEIFNEALLECQNVLAGKLCPSTVYQSFY